METSPATVAEWRRPHNLVAAARLAAAPLLAWAVIGAPRWLAAAGVLMAGAGDVVAGGRARATARDDRLYPMLDPAADRAVSIGTTLALLARGLVPAYLAVPVVLREIAVSGGFVALGRYEVDRPLVKPAGRTATAALAGGSFLVLVGWGPFRPAGLLVFALGLAVSLLAAYRYLVDVRARVGRARRLED